MVKTFKAHNRSRWQQECDVILALIIRETKTRFGHLRLGILWAFLEPIAHIAFFSFVWGLRGHLSVMGVHAYYFILSGILPWNLFQNVVTRLMSAAEANRGLFSFHQVRPMHAFIARSFLELSLFCFLFFILVLVGLYFGLEIKVHDFLTMMLAYGLLFILAFSLGGCLAVLKSEFPESEKMIGIGLRVLYFASGIFFACKTLPYEHQGFFALNPVLSLIDYGRFGFFHVELSDFIDIDLVLLEGAGLMLLFVALYKKFWQRIMAT